MDSNKHEKKISQKQLPAARSFTARTRLQCTSFEKSMAYIYIEYSVVYTGNCFFPLIARLTVQEVWLQDAQNKIGNCFL